MALVSALFAFWVLVVLGILLLYRRELLALWREPMLKVPVLIIESDDWGAGPLEQAPALLRIASILERYQDRMGKHPVMTIAVILAVPDGAAIRESGHYHRTELNTTRFLPILKELKKGASKGVFGLQLHGLEHYWQETLMKSGDPQVQQWLRQEEPQLTESLPAHLQSRWIDASVLPSRSLPPSAIKEAVAEETELFATCFGRSASVAVPTTFIWNDRVESAWAQQGIDIVITPGCRNGCRDASGLPGCKEGPIHNADRGAGVLYLVRNDYFEPEKGHTAEKALAALRRKTKEGRPCLLETHRSNFLGKAAVRSFTELEELLATATTEFSDLRFMSSEALGAIFASGRSRMLEHSFPNRFCKWVERLKEIHRFRKLALLTGLYPLLQLLTLTLRRR